MFCLLGDVPLAEFAAIGRVRVERPRISLTGGGKNRFGRRRPVGDVVGPVSRVAVDVTVRQGLEIRTARLGRTLIPRDIILLVARG